MEDQVANIVAGLESGEIPGLDGSPNDYYAKGGVQLAFDGIIAGAPRYSEVGCLLRPWAGRRAPEPIFRVNQPPRFQVGQKGEDPFVYTEPPTPGKSGADDTNRYHLPLNNGSNWTEPFTDPETGRTIAEFGMRFGPSAATS